MDIDCTFIGKALEPATLDQEIVYTWRRSCSAVPEHGTSSVLEHLGQHSAFYSETYQIHAGHKKCLWGHGLLCSQGCILVAVRNEFTVLIPSLFGRLAKARHTSQRNDTGMGTKNKPKQQSAAPLPYWRM